VTRRRTAHRSLSHAAALVVRALEPEACVLIGGLAVAAHGHVRATRDVDFITRLPLEEARRRLSKHGYQPETRRGDPHDGLPTFLRVTVADTPVDILPQLVAIDWDHLPQVRLEAATVVSVVDVDSLILLKLRAGGVRDVMDVAHLVWRHPDRLGLARDLAGRHGVSHHLESFLVDRRERRRLADELSRTPHGRKVLATLRRLLPLP